MYWKKLKGKFLKENYIQKSTKLAKMPCSAFLKIMDMEMYMVMIQNFIFDFIAVDLFYSAFFLKR